MTWYGKDFDPTTPSAQNTTANWCRGHPVPASTIGGGFTTPVLSSVRFYGGDSVTGDCLIGVFQGGTVGDPDTGDFLGEAYFASPGADQWNEAAISGGPVSIDVDDVIWLHLKANGSIDVRYDDTSGEAEDWYSTEGRYVSTAVSSDPTDSFTNDDPWPTDGGSTSLFWYYFGFEITEGSTSPTISDVDHDKLYPGATATVAGTLFGASQSTSKVYISPTATWVLADAVEVVATSWSATSIGIRVLDLRDAAGDAVTGDTFMHVVLDPGGTPDASNGFAIVSDYPDHLYQVKKLVAPTSTQSVNVTFDKVPRIVWIHSIYRVSDGTEVHLKWHTTLLTASGSRGIGMFSSNSSGDWSRYQEDDGSFKLYNDTGTTFPVLAALSISGNNVVFNFTAVDTAVQIYVAAICSDTDLIDVAVGDFAVSSGSVSGLGFQPDCVNLLTVGSTFPTDGTTHALISWGMATGDDESALNGYAGDPNTDAHSLIDSGNVCAQLSGTSYTWEMTAFTFTSGGFSWTGSNADEVGYLAFRLNGVRCGSGVVTVPTGTAPVDMAFPDFGWVPQGYICLSGSEPTQTESLGLNCRVSVGFYDNDEKLCAFATSAEGAANSDRRQDSAESVLELGDDAATATARIVPREIIRHAPLSIVETQDDDEDRVLVFAVEEVSPRKHEGLNAGQSIPL